MSLVARYLEERGIPTLCMASALDIIRAGKPPRAVFIDYPLGHTMGKPFDKKDQKRIMREALSVFDNAREPTALIDLQLSWADDESWKERAMNAHDGDQRSPRDDIPRYQCDEDRLLAEANNSI